MVSFSITRTLRFLVATAALAVPLYGMAGILNVSNVNGPAPGAMLAANAGGHTQGDLGAPGMMHASMRPAIYGTTPQEAAKMFPIQAALSRLSGLNLDIKRNQGALEVAAKRYVDLQKSGEISQVTVIPIFHPDPKKFAASKRYSKNLAKGLEKFGVKNVVVLYVDDYPPKQDAAPKASAIPPGTAS